MGSFTFSTLFRAPEVNPINHKARSIPILNPINKYGRVFFFSWLGFMVAFLSWYAFPPLLTITIRKDLHMTQNDVANSNIIALLATLLVRFICGPLCDRFGPRKVFVGTLLAGSIPTAMAGLATNAKGLIAVRFFVGILGGSFVPCQVWCTGFFDKNVVGTANSLAGGWGNSGGGITYFVMPAIFDSLVNKRHLTPHKAWRVAYIVPFIIICSIAIAMLLLCDDTPTGNWSERHLRAQQALNAHGVHENILDGASDGAVVDAPGPISGTTPHAQQPSASDSEEKIDPAKKDFDHEAQMGETDMIETAKGEIVVAPTRREALRVVFSLHSMALALPYACSFGSELAFNSIIGAYYAHNFPSLGQTKSGDWAAMFGLLNVVFRPLGGFTGDMIYRRTRSVWAKKLWMTFLSCIMGVFEIALGVTDPKKKSTMFGLVAGLAFFLEAANGANFAVVPHVHPFANGILSGIVGGMGNFGGIIFAIIFRYNGVHYGKSLWIIGIIAIVVNLAVGWVRPIPKGQIGGR